MKMKDIYWKPKAASLPSSNGWGERHAAALVAPHGAEIGIAVGFKGWCAYADLHWKRYSSEIGEDSVLGPAWAQWGAALRTLLNGELGRLDAGTLDGIIANNLEVQGFNPDDL